MFSLSIMQPFYYVKSLSKGLYLKRELDVYNDMYLDFQRCT